MCFERERERRQTDRQRQKGCGIETAATCYYCETLFDNDDFATQKQRLDRKCYCFW